MYTKTAVSVVLVPGQGRGAALTYADVTKGATSVSSQALRLNRLPPGRVSAATDIDGDGFSDLIVATPAAKRAYLFAGSPHGLSDRPILIEPGDRPLRFGTSLSVGDYNGDGFGDVALGGYSPTLGHVLYVYAGGQTGLGRTPPAVLTFPSNRQPGRN